MHSLPSPGAATVYPLRDPARLDDDALVAALRAGNSRAAGAFFERFHGHVERVLTRIFGGYAEVADMVNETFLRALDRIDRLEDPRGTRPWLTTIAVHVAREHMRACRRRGWLRFVGPSELPEPAAPVPSPETQEAARHLYAALEKMPADERIALALRFVDGMELTEVAAACGVSLATVKRMLSRAEERFVAISRGDSVLRERLEGGGRWSGR